MEGLEGCHQAAHINLNRAFFAQFTPHAILQPLAQVEQAAGQAPGAFARRVAALHNEHAPGVIKDGGGGAHKRRFGVATVESYGAAGFVRGHG